MTQVEKCRVFRALHERDHAFIIPNPWDVGTAKLLAHLGFEALATTSAGYAFSAGQRDNTIGRDEMLAHVSAVVAATDLPVSADLENGFGDSAEVVAETIRMAGATGLAGASIEDMSQRPDDPIYEHSHAVERIRAAAEVVRGLGFRFTLTARAENYLVGRPDLGDTIRRLQAYQEAGADVLYAPGLTQREDIAAGGEFGGPAGERGDGPAGSAIEPGRTFGLGSPAGECGGAPFRARGPGCISPCGQGNEGARNV